MCCSSNTYSLIRGGGGVWQLLLLVVFFVFAWKNIKLISETLVNMNE